MQSGKFLLAEDTQPQDHTGCNRNYTVNEEACLKDHRDNQGRSADNEQNVEDIAALNIICLR